MATNATAIPGEKVFTIGIRVTAADVAAAGTNSVLIEQNVTFTGGAEWADTHLGRSQQARHPECPNELHRYFGLQQRRTSERELGKHREQCLLQGQLVVQQYRWHVAGGRLMIRG